MSQVTLRQKSSKILLIGDSCKDIYHFGTTKRKNPESPAPLLKIERTEIRDGMALNVAANLRSLGCDVEVLTNKVKPKKERFFDESYSYQLLRVDSDDVIEGIEETALDQFIGHSGDFSCVVVSDYDKGFLNNAALRRLTQIFICPIFVDTKKRNLSAIDVDHVFVKVNENESKLLTHRLTQANLIVTRGQHGATFGNQIFPADRCTVFDVCGAGDTFLAALAAEFVQTGDIMKAIKFANKAAAIAVQHLGTYAVNRSEIEH